MNKFLFITDTHGVLPQEIPNLNERIKDVEAIFHSGDFTNFEDNMKKILIAWDKLNKPLFLIKGNHEPDLDKKIKKIKLENITYIHNKVVVFKNYLICGLGGGGFEPDIPNTKILRKKLRVEIAKEENKNKKIILLTHAPPFGTNLDFLDIFTGNVEIRKFIEEFKPIICSCGHIHENENNEDKIGETKVINPGWQGAIVEIGKDVKCEFSENANEDFFI